MALGLTQPLTEMSTRNILWGVKVVSAWGWQPYHSHVSVVWKSGIIILLELSWPAQAFAGFKNIYISPTHWYLSNKGHKIKSIGADWIYCVSGYVYTENVFTKWRHSLTACWWHHQHRQSSICLLCTCHKSFIVGYL